MQYLLSLAWMLDPRYRSSPPLPGWPSVDDVKTRLIQSAVAANTERAEEPSVEKNLSLQFSETYLVIDQSYFVFFFIDL